jgi:thioredoxin 1
MKKTMAISQTKYYLQAFLLAIFLIAGNSLYTSKSSANSSAHINFIENSFDEALKQAAIQHKYVFVDAYASWCGPCKMLKAKTFTDSKVAEFYNSNFINVSIDMEKGRGPELAAKWGMRAYPTLIIFSPDGKPVLGTEGFLGASDLLRFGKQALARQ